MTRAATMYRQAAPVCGAGGHHSAAPALRWLALLHYTGAALANPGHGLGSPVQGAAAAPDFRSRLFVAQCVPLSMVGRAGTPERVCRFLVRSANPARPATLAWQPGRQVLDLSQGAIHG